jgi:hypothetical protein
VPAQGGYYAVGYAGAAPTPVYVVPSVRQPRQHRSSSLEFLALHAGVTGVVAGSLASLGLMGTVRSASRVAARRSTPLMVETETKPSILDQMRGVVVKTEKKVVEEPEDSKSMMQKVKDAGKAGIISYIFWEWIFWGVSVPVACFGFQAATGHWPNFSDQDDLAKLGAEAFAFVNVARFAIPLRIGLALSTTPWVQANIVDKFQKEDA